MRGCNRVVIVAVLLHCFLLEHEYSQLSSLGLLGNAGSVGHTALWVLRNMMCAKR
jgi:hypothetical protein